MIKKLTFMLITVLSAFYLAVVFFTFPTFAQDAPISGASNSASLGVANSLVVSGNSSVGSIVCTTPTGFIVCDNSYDSRMSGVVVEKPAVSFNLTGEADAHPVISSGNSYVLANGEGGNIKKGDLITTSQTAGVGMKAAKSGYTLGSALDDVSFTNPSETKLITVAINIRYYNAQSAVRGSLKDIFSLSALAATESPLVVLRYVTAGLVLTISVFLGFWIFGKTANRGLDALGRNPMAQGIIRSGMVLNIFLAMAVVAGGVVIAFLVVKL